MPEPDKSHSNRHVILFVVIICFAASSILALLATALKKPQEKAAEFYRSKQLLIAAHILNYEEQFILRESPEKTQLAKYDAQRKILVPTDEEIQASESEILELYQTRVIPSLTNKQGELLTFQQAGIDYRDYLVKHEKNGSVKLPEKLLYVIKPNLPPDELNQDLLPYGYVIPIKGEGLWAPIRGFLGLAANANTVIGATWYDQKETPGLGGNISLPSWQKQFYNKVIFQKNPNGETNFKTAPLGILVVKTTVEQTIGDKPKADSAVDGVPGSSFTMNSVTESYRKTLNLYRPFLLNAHKRYMSEGGEK